MLGVAGQHPLERHVVLAEELGAAAGLVGDGEDAVDIGIVLLHVAELVLHELAHRGGAVHAGDDGHVVARADAAVLALVAVEVAHLRGGIVIHRPHVHAHLVPVGGQLPDAEVLGVDVVAHRDGLGGEADHLAIAPHRLAGAARVAGDLVPGRMSWRAVMRAPPRRPAPCRP